MQPHKPRKPERALHAARLLLEKDLGWLRGYPLARSTTPAGLPWASWPQPGEISGATIHVTQETLRTSTLSLEKLNNRFPQALPRLVPDCRAWLLALRARISILKETIHGGASLPTLDLLPARLGLPAASAREVLRLAARMPGLEALLEALTWALPPAAGLLHDALPLLAQEGVSFVRGLQLFDRAGLSSLATALGVLQLAAAEGRDRVQKLLQLLCDPLSYTVPLGGSENHVERWIAIVHKLNKPRGRFSGEWPERPTATLGPSVACQIPALLRLGAHERRSALTFLNLLLPAPALLARWGRWWGKLEGLTRPVQLRSTWTSRRMEPSPGDSLCEELTAHSRRSPPPYAMALLEPAFQPRILEGGELSRRLAEVLALVPEELDGTLPRGILLGNWIRPAQERGSLLRFLGCLRDQLREPHRDPGEVLAPWRDLLRWSFADDDRRDPGWVFFSGKVDPRWIPHFFQALGAIRKRQEVFDRFLGSGDSSLLAHLVAVTQDSRLAVDYYSELVRRLQDTASFAEATTGSRIASRKPLATLHAVAGGRSTRFGSLVAALSPAFLQSGKLHCVCRTTEVLDLETVRRLLLGGAALRLLRVGERLDALDSLNAGPRELKHIKARAQKTHKRGHPDWIKRYPGSLRPTLRRLGRVDPRAERAVARLLPGWRPVTHVAREIEVLGEEAARASGPRAEHVQRRITNLRRRLSAAPEAPSPARVRRMVAKLELRLGMLQVEHVESRLDQEIGKALQEKHQLTLPEEVLGRPGFAGLLVPLLSLDRAHRDLALGILRARAGPRPWDLREAPANRRFLERLVRAGLEPEAWLEGPGPRAFELPGGQRVTLELESDPLEVLRMGEPFQTCLAPGNFNFFSAVANAVDINKRVLYARRRDGVVVGRCLLALSKDLEVLCFHPYAHDASLGFEQLVADFVRGLALRLGARCAPEGEVETLEASDWYDDGPLDVTGQLRFLEEGSTFRTKLRTVAPPELGHLFEEDTGSRCPEAIFLPHVLQLPEIENRPDLVPELLRRVRELGPPPVEALLSLAQRLRKSGARALATESALLALEHRGWSAGINHWLVPQLAEELVDLGKPTEALRFLRRTRSRGTRRWGEEPTDRLAVAARAHELLHRRADALRLYRELSARSPDQAVWKRAIVRVEADE